MNERYPILILIPHGGIAVPEELAESSAMDKFRLFLHGNTCAPQIFDVRDISAGWLSFNVSRFFVDADASPYDGIEKVTSRFDLNGRSVFAEGCFPDEIALSGIVKRYWLPFHNEAENIIKQEDIELILDCRTVMAVAPPGATDEGAQRPTIAAFNKVDTGRDVLVTCADELAAAFLAAARDNFCFEEQEDVDIPLAPSREPARGYILEKYGTTGIPTLRICLSKALFLCSPYFNLDDVSVSELRLLELNDKMQQTMRQFCRRVFKR